MKRTWVLRDDGAGHLPSHDEASLVALVVHAANALAPPFAVALVRRPVKQYEHEETSIETYSLTSESLHGDRPAVRWIEIQERSTDGAGPSSDATRIVVTAEGLSPSEGLRLVIDVRPPPFVDAGLRIEATIEAGAPARVDSAAAVFDQCFGVPHAH